MKNQALKIRSTLVLILGILLLCSGASARADDNHGNNNYNQGDHHGNRYHYRNGHWYGQGEVVVADLPVGVEVESLPPQYTTVVVGNTSYYYDNARYYNRSPDGAYIVVAPPQRPGINLNVRL